MNFLFCSVIIILAGNEIVILFCNYNTSLEMKLLFCSVIIILAGHELVILFCNYNTTWA